MKNIILSTALFICGLSSHAQNSTDALRYSRIDYTGTARFSAMGGAFGALGGEVSALSINPGGIGVYRNSEFTFSTGFNNYSSSLNYRGTTKDDGRLNFNIPNVAYVGSYKGDPNGWKNYSFAINYNRVNSFNSETLLSGNNNNSTLIDDYVSILNNDNASLSDVEGFSYPFGPSQAWQLILIDTLTNQSTGRVDYIPYVFLDDFLNTGRTLANIEQERRIRTQGNQSETQFTFGGNYQDRFYLGGSIGLQRVRYEQDYSFKEIYTYSPGLTPGDSSFITSFQETSNLEIKGTGVNFKIGLIYKLTEQLRAGISIHSPTFFGLNEIYLYDIRSDFSSGQTFRADSITSNFEYRVSTPARYNLSLAYIFMQKAAINFDYEYVDYATAKFNDKTDFEKDYSAQNDQIETNFTGTHNFRVGAEYRFNPFAFRLGYNYQGNPYASNVPGFDESRSTYSIGGGFRHKNFNFDVGINIREMTASDGVYTTSDARATIDETETNLILTAGWRW